jgi:hypothetical protein
MKPRRHQQFTIGHEFHRLGTGAIEDAGRVFQAYVD